MTRRSLGNAFTDDLGIAFGQRLRAARQGARLTQDQLADRAGLSRVTVAVWEGGGGGAARIDQVKALAAALGEHPGVLAFGC